MSLVLTYRRRALAASGLLVLCAWPVIFSSSYNLRILTIVGISALMVLGYQLIFGHAGVLALSQGAFFGLGAYTAALLSVRFGWPFAAALPAATVVSLVVAMLIAAPVLRLQSHYLTLATLGIGQVFLLLAVKLEPITGGANGISGIPLPSLFGIVLGRGWPMLIATWSIFAIGALLVWQITRGLYGQMCHVLRANPLAAQSLGFDIGRMRIELFLIGSALAAVAGVLQVYVVRIASPELLEFKWMVACLAMAVVGGRTSIAGAVAGAFLLVQLPEWLRASGQVYLVINGLLLLGLVVLAPRGLAGLLDRWMPAQRRLAGPATTPQAPQACVSPAASGAADDVLLSVRGLCKSFGGVTAIDALSFSLKRGEVLGVIGPNGSGKTTMVNCITGIYAADGGGIEFDGVRIEGMLPNRIAALGMARTFQNIRLVDDMSVIDNIAVARAMPAGVTLLRTLATSFADKDCIAARAWAWQMIARLGLEHVAHEPAGALPYGLKRLVEIGRALATEPQLLLLDEPAAGLNETEQVDLAQRLFLLAERGLTVLVIEHNMAFLHRLATRLICLENGRLIADGAPDEVCSSPRVIEAYLGQPAEAAR